MAAWRQHWSERTPVEIKDEAMRLAAWEFDVWQTPSEDSLIDAVVDMWQHLGLLAVFRMHRDALTQFLYRVRTHYRAANPYHNFRHCVDVVQAVYHALMLGGACKLLQPLEILAALLAAVIHDVGHDGHNNAFHIATGSDLALTYNDRSVLENFHCSQGWRLIIQSGLLTGGASGGSDSGLAGSDITGCAQLTRDELKIVRRLLVDAVLATDISQHMELTNKFKTLIKSGFDPSDDNHRSLLVTILVKFGDISNPCRPAHIAKHWARMVQEEFFLQGDAERRLQLPVSPFMDRGYSLAQMQLNFIDYIVHPLVFEVSLLIPNLQPVMHTLTSNQEQWRLLLEEERRIARAAAAATATTTTSGIRETR
jgi:hypothetical protein